MYNTKSTGGIIGADTAINDESTIIGIAVANSRTDIKLKDYLLGVKSKVKSWVFGIYGLQYLKDQWFAKGNVMYSTARVKATEPRFELGNYKTARYLIINLDHGEERYH
ncbi:MAG: autotransporter outer membrane beta-barrel domain-containing protein [Candidatus Rickettsia vulgarisii]